MHDGLDRIEQQFLLAARRRVDRRRTYRRRGAGGLAAVLVVLGASGASALAGVGPVSALLTSEPPADTAPAADQPRVTVVAEGWAMRAYRKPDGGFCIQAPPSAPIEAACAPEPSLRRELTTSGAFTSVATPQDGTNLVFGIARGDASQVTVSDQDGRRWAGDLSAPWATLGEVELKGFLAVVEGPTPFAERPLTVELELPEGEIRTSPWPAQR